MYANGIIAEALKIMEPFENNTEMNFDFHLSYSKILFQEAKSNPISMIHNVKTAIYHCQLACKINETSYEAHLLLG
jgi:hypothetical protein